MRLDSGVLVVITHKIDPSLRVGSPVHVQGSGPDACVRLG